MGAFNPMRMQKVFDAAMAEIDKKIKVQSPDMSDVLT